MKFRMFENENKFCALIVKNGNKIIYAYQHNNIAEATDAMKTIMVNGCQSDGWLEAFRWFFRDHQEKNPDRAMWKEDGNHLGKCVMKAQTC